jgi:hypothetical protein
MEFGSVDAATNTSDCIASAASTSRSAKMSSTSWPEMTVSPGIFAGSANGSVGLVCFKYNHGDPAGYVMNASTEHESRVDGIRGIYVKSVRPAQIR